MEVLEKELDWKYYGGKHYESIYTRIVQSYILPKKFNIDYRRSTAASQICAGEITREQALEELLSKPYCDKQVAEDKEYFCKKLGISITEFDIIMSELPKSYSTYPNNEKLLQFIYSVYRRFF